MKSVSREKGLLVNRMVQYLRGGLLIALLLVTFGSGSAIASASTASASPAAGAQVAVMAPPATDNPDKERNTENSLNMISNAVWITAGCIVLMAIGAVIYTLVRRKRPTDAEEGEYDPEVEKDEGGTKPPA
jgi:heme/copper-type cytochrome/quinol oxidase subunit 2